GMVYLALTWVVRLFEPAAFEPLHERPLLLYSVAALLLGAQMMSIGFLAELITAYQSRDEDSYSISEQTGRGPWTGLRAPRPAVPSAVALLAAADPIQGAALAEAGYHVRVNSDNGIIFRDGWQSLDKVLNPVTQEYVSSKPPLLSTLVAGLYWLLKHLFGWS